MGERSYLICLPHSATDYIQSTVARTGRPYEERMLQAMAASLEPGQIVVDVGANIGNHSLYLAAVAGCRIVAYEPNADLVEGFRRSVLANSLTDQITIREVAVYSSPGLGVLTNLNPHNLGAQSIAMADTGDFRVVTLDTEAFPGRVAALKIDVEGAQLEVLKGGRELIVRDRPDIYVECALVEEFREVCAFMQDLGYWLAGTYNFTPTHVFVPSGGPRQQRAVVAALIAATEECYRLETERRSLRDEVHRLRTAHDRLAAQRETANVLPRDTPDH